MILTKKETKLVTFKIVCADDYFCTAVIRCDILLYQSMCFWYQNPFDTLHLKQVDNFDESVLHHSIDIIQQCISLTPSHSHRLAYDNSWSRSVLVLHYALHTSKSGDVQNHGVSHMWICTTVVLVVPVFISDRTFWSKIYLNKHYAFIMSVSGSWKLTSNTLIVT